MEINYNPLKRKKISPNIHSELHLLVAQTRAQFGETAKKGKGSFSFYLGFFKRLGIDTVYRLLAEMKAGGNEGQVKLFWWLVKKELEKRK